MSNIFHPNNIIESMDLPKDLFLGMPDIAMIGNRELNIMNHRGIMRYEDDEVIILSKNIQIIVKGTNLYIAAYSKDEIKLKGYINSMEFS